MKIFRDEYGENYLQLSFTDFMISLFIVFIFTFVFTSRIFYMLGAGDTENAVKAAYLKGQNEILKKCCKKDKKHAIPELSKH